MTKVTQWSPRGPFLLGAAAIAALLLGFSTWGVQARIAGAVVAPGQVEVEHRRQIVQHPDGGVVADILTSEGARVSAGQILLRLDGGSLRSEFAVVEGQYFELLARRGRLEAERGDLDRTAFPDELVDAARTDRKLAALMAGQASLFRTRKDTVLQSRQQLAKQSEQIRVQIFGVDAQLKALDRQQKLVERELADQQALLSKGLAQATRVLALEREAARMDGEAGALQAERAAAETRRSELDVERLRMAAQRREDAETQLRDLGPQELELAERRRNLARQVGRLDLRAPAAGIVYDLRVTTPDAVIRPAETLMYVVPQDRPLVVGARIAPINIDEVRVGQAVVLRFSSLSSRTTPEVDGVLSRVSADVLTDEASHSPYYRAEVTIPAEEIDKLGALSVIPGMPVEVYIQTGIRSPLAYLIKPLADYFNRAFRES